MNSNRLGSVGVVAQPKGDGFFMKFQYPTGTDHTGRTMTFVIRNKKTGKQLTLSGPGTEITVASEVIEIVAPSATVSEADAAISLADIESLDDRSEFGFRVLDSSGVLVHRFQGEVVWADEAGLFNES